MRLLNTLMIAAAVTVTTVVGGANMASAQDGAAPKCDDRGRDRGDVIQHRKEMIERFKENHPNAKPWIARDRCEDLRDRKENHADRREDKGDQAEDRRDRREDARDAQHDGGRRDKIEDRRDRREDLRDKAEDRRDRAENQRDRRENQRDRNHGVAPRRR